MEYYPSRCQCRATMKSMNTLLVGASDKTEAILSRLQEPYLLIDDGPIIEAVESKKGFHFDPEKHSIDVLKGMDYRRARDFVALINAVFPEGESTLTRKNATFELLTALLAQPDRLDTLMPESKDPAKEDARQKIETLLLSPVLKSVLTKRSNFKLEGTIFARLDRKKLGDFDAFVLAHLLISRYGGQVVIPDFGFYGREYLSYLMREDRLVCGVYTLAELSPALRQRVLLIDEKVGGGTTAEDAEVLTDYEGISRAAHTYSERVNELIH